jgi:hypothetical protein
MLANTLSRYPDLQPDFADTKQEFTTTLLAPELFGDLPNLVITSCASKIDKEKEPDNRININNNPNLQLKIIQGQHDSPLRGNFGITNLMI